MVKRLFFLSILIGAIIFSCSDDSHYRHKKDSVSFDLDSISIRGRLIAVTDFNSVNYFIYKGEPMGFYYDLLKAFADQIGVELEIATENHLQDAIDMLHNGEADLLATGLPVSTSLGREIRFTEPLDETRQVLVQRRPQNWRKMSVQSVENIMVRNLKDLSGRTVYVEEGSSHSEYLHSATKKNKKAVKIIEVPYDSEKLIQLIETNEIDYAVCDENISLVNATYYPGIDVSTPVSPPKGLSWGIRKTHSGKLLKNFNQWITTFRKTPTYAMLYAKYFRNSRSVQIIKSDYFSLNSGRVSQWDNIIKVYSDSVKWDWRLLASLICQESRFVPDVKSWAGAYGLMQVMPETGQEFKINIASSPGNNIKAGVRYINRLQSIFDPKIPDENERIRFILAAYNAGPGHVLDAMKLAEKNGKDSKKWDNNVAVWLLKKSEHQYFNDPVVRNGYFRGKESIAFVNEVLDRYEHYKNIIP